MDRISRCAALAMLLTGCTPTEVPEADIEPGWDGRVTLTTSLGTIVLELDESAAPIGVANFVRYLDDGFYDGGDGGGETVFHRVISGFMVQGGGFTENLGKKSTRPPIDNEADNGLLNTRGTVAWARLSDAHTATSQFFINHADNAFLDPSMGNAGYAVFGEVFEGMDVVDAIAEVATSTQAGMDDVPVEPVAITAATR